MASFRWYWRSSAQRSGSTGRNLGSFMSMMICRRDIEESFMARLQIIMLMNEPKFLPVEPDRWAEERQYQRNDAMEALQAFRARRDESLKFLRGLKVEQWERGGIHATRGHMSIKDFVSLMAWHDDNHLDQLKRALKGQP